MAEVTRSAAQTAADTIANETSAGANTAARVGGAIRDTVDSVLWNHSDIATNRPASGDYVGQLYFATDTGVQSRWDGSAWVTVTLAPPADPADDDKVAIASSGNLVYALIAAANIAAGAVNASKLAVDVTLAAILNNGASAGNGAITSLADPTNPQDAATKAYVDSVPSAITWAAVLANGATSGANSPTIDAGQAVNYAGEVDVQRQTVTVLDTSGGNTRIHAPSGQAVQAVIDGSVVADLYAAAGVYGLSFYGDIGTTAAIFVNKPTTAINGPHAGLYAAQGGDGGATDGGNSFLRPGAAGSAGGGTAGRAQLLDSTATERFAVTATGTLEASAQLTLSLTAIATAQTPGAILENSTAATAGATQQHSPMQGFLAHGWDGSAADVTIEAAWQLQPLGTDTGGTSHHKLLTRTGGSGAWQEVGRFAFEAGDPTTAPAFLLNGSTNSDVRFGAVDVNSSQPAPGSWLQGSANAGAGDDGDAGIRNAAGTPRIYHDASANTDKIGDLSGGTVLATVSTAALELGNEGGTPATPGTDLIRIYNESSTFKWIDDAGVVHS